MASRNAAIADAVVTALNSGSFSQTFTAVRRYVPMVDIPKLRAAGLTVTVLIGVKDEASRTSRDANEHDIRILIGVEKVIETADVSAALANGELDPLLQLVEEINDFFTSATIAQTVALFLQASILNPYHPPSLLTEKIFRGIVAVDFLKVV
jgi:hypothetical protein